VALYVINKGYGYLLGTVMQKVEKQKHKATDGSSDDNEVAWEYTSLEESVVEACYLSSAVIVGWHIESVWQPVSQLRRKRSRERPKAKNRSEVLRITVSGLNSNFSDDKYVGQAPFSDNESVHVINDENDLSSSTEDEDMEDDNDHFLECMILGKNQETKNDMESLDADCDDPSNSTINDIAPEEQGRVIEGLNWDTTFNINEPPAGRKPTKGCSVESQY